MELQRSDNDLVCGRFCEAEEGCADGTSFWCRVRGKGHPFYSFSDSSVTGYQMFQKL